MSESKKYIDIRESSLILGVSEATVRNWIKTDIVFSNENKNLDYDEVIELSKKIKNGELDRLNKRRNKNHIASKIIPKKYCDDKQGIALVTKILSTIIEDVKSEDIAVILAEYVLKEFYHLRDSASDFSQVMIKTLDKNSEIGRFIEGFFTELKISDRIDSIICKNESSLKFEPVKLTDDFLGLLYQSLQLTSVKKKDGIYYTPSRVVSEMVEDVVLRDPERELTILDPCCGSGNFLLSLVKKGYSYNNLFGFELDPISTFISRSNVFLASGAECDSLPIIVDNILCKNSYLEIENDRKFDICIGNPPWGSLIENDLSFLSRWYKTTKAKGTESFGLFIELGIHLIKEGGIISYIVPESLVNVEGHRNIRSFMLKNLKMESVNFWGNCFEGVLAPAFSFVAKKSKGLFIDNVKVKKSSGQDFIIESREMNESSWNLKYDDTVFNLSNKILNAKNCTSMKNSAEFALGIVTGNNKKYLESKKSKYNQPIVRGNDIYKFQIKNPVNYIEYTPEKFQQVAKNQLYFEKEKLVYRFISDTFVFAYDDTQLLSLNSANVVVPYVKNMNMKYICAILNSRISHLIFKTQFESIKVLRNHIESIPLKYVNEKVEMEIVDLVNTIRESHNDQEKILLYEKLDDVIMDIYELDAEEKSIVKSFNTGNIFLF